MTHDQIKSNIKNKERQISKLKNQNEIFKNSYCVFELIFFRKIISKYQETNNRSQKRTFANNKKFSQTFQIQKQLYSEKTNIFLVFDKKRFHKQKNMFFFFCFFCHRKLI